MKPPSEISAAADVLLAAARAVIRARSPGEPPAGAPGVAMLEVLWSAKRAAPADALGALVDVMTAVGLELHALPADAREGVLRVLKQRLTDAARRDLPAAPAVH